ncbi:hypothetical protein CBR_g53539 [Chara braunii]|uniref:Uncharacterized protein n=1 Tax=Chara braunii TaxID=69332 RepID=A0A388MB41_CHABU|nr:hypothetical protein CBR_g53539 [Chara braunii]|eukprot:GBG91725.1 hypothetical protein CBR_g53539 [Chara braunii]
MAQAITGQRVALWDASRESPYLSQGRLVFSRDNAAKPTLTLPLAKNSRSFLPWSSAGQCPLVAVFRPSRSIRATSCSKDLFQWPFKQFSGLTKLAMSAKRVKSTKPGFYWEVKSERQWRPQQQRPEPQVLHCCFTAIGSGESWRSYSHRRGAKHPGATWKVVQHRTIAEGILRCSSRLRRDLQQPDLNTALSCEGMSHWIDPEESGEGGDGGGDGGEERGGGGEGEGGGQEGRFRKTNGSVIDLSLTLEPPPAAVSFPASPARLVPFSFLFPGKSFPRFQVPRRWFLSVGTLSLSLVWEMMLQQSRFASAAGTRETTRTVDQIGGKGEGEGYQSLSIPPLGTEGSIVKMTTGDNCYLGVSVYPDFEYNAGGAGGIGTAVDQSDDRIALRFDCDHLLIPPVKWDTAKFLGIPIPPPLRIDIQSKSLEGYMDRSTGKVELNFLAQFLFTVGSLYKAPPLLVETTLTTETARGSMRGGVGKRIDASGNCKLVGIATVPRVDDHFMNAFLMLPTEVLAIMQSRFEFIPAKGLASKKVT